MTAQSERVLAAIRKDIVTTRFSPGQVLLEADLAHEYEVSKTPVREALRTLIVEGLVQVMPRRGYVVRQIGLADVRDVIELRLVLEPHFAAVAAERSSPELALTLRKLLDQQQQAQQTKELTTAAREFHEVVIAASKNTRAITMAAGLFDETTRMNFLMPAIDERIHSTAELAEHEAIAQAIEAADPAQAEAAMRDHLLTLRQVIVTAFLN